METAGIGQYREFLIILGAAGLVIPLFVRLGVSSILGFLLVGFLLSRDVLGSFTSAFPFLQALVITDEEAVSSLGELGVVFLLFLIGLELSFERLVTMKRLVFGLGSLQVVFTTALVSLAAFALDFTPAQSLVIGTALSLSSTAIVVQIYSIDKRLGSQSGRTSFAILLFQDLAVIPILLMVGILGHESSGPVLQGVAIALAQALLAVALIIGVGRFALRPLLRLVAGINSSDLFMAAVLLIAVGTGVLANYAGLSMALGAFIAGLTLAETEYRRAIEAVIEPFKGLLLGAFFLLVGLGIDLDGVVESPVQIVAMAIAIIVSKTAVTYLFARAMRVNHAAALETALLLGPCGEFAFVILSSAAATGILDRAMFSKLLLIVSLTMAAIPLLAILGKQLVKRSKRLQGNSPETLEAPPEDDQPRIIVAGFGRVGHLIGSMLDEHKIPYIAVDADAALVTRERRAGFPVYYGDAANIEFLKKCGLADAKAIAITMDNPVRVDDVARAARAESAGLKIIARARDERHAMRLYTAGVTEAVPETIESSLQLGESLLVEAGIPMGLVIASVHERRDTFRKLLGRPNRKMELDLERKRLRRGKALP
ncbi:MAG: cation:proton antiporter [Aestuariivirga sp.]|nr:cation:proton antiporter [Aestuariivirga sp.]